MDNLISIQHKMPRIEFLDESHWEYIKSDIFIHDNLFSLVFALRFPLYWLNDKNSMASNIMESNF